jgi:hypothetical protein
MLNGYLHPGPIPKEQLQQVISDVIATQSKQVSDRIFLQVAYTCLNLMEKEEKKTAT